MYESHSDLPGSSAVIVANGFLPLLHWPAAVRNEKGKEEEARSDQAA
jgi:hypothetical protein